MTTRRLIFSGTREPLSEQDRNTLLTLVQTWAGQADEIGVGDCPTGVDALIREWLPEARVFVADWRKHKGRAGPIRNAEMVAWAYQAEEAFLIAMPGTESIGTWDCVREAARWFLPIVVAPTGCKPIQWAEDVAADEEPDIDNETLLAWQAVMSAFDDEDEPS